VHLVGSFCKNFSIYRLKNHKTECNTGLILKTQVFWDVTLSRWASIFG